MLRVSQRSPRNPLMHFSRSPRCGVRTNPHIIGRHEQKRSARHSITECHSAEWTDSHSLNHSAGLIAVQWALISTQTRMQLERNQNVIVNQSERNCETRTNALSIQSLSEFSWMNGFATYWIIPPGLLPFSERSSEVEWWFVQHESYNYPIIITTSVVKNKFCNKLRTKFFEIS